MQNAERCVKIKERREKKERKRKEEKRAWTCKCRFCAIYMESMHAGMVEKDTITQVPAGLVIAHLPIAVSSAYVEFSAICLSMV
jgi:hypothetical protein